MRIHTCLVLLVLRLTASQVFVTPPGEFVSIPGGSASFFCLSVATNTDAIVHVTWFVNGRSLEDFDLDNVDTLGAATLRFSPVSLDHNGTSIMCSADHASGIRSTSPTSLLLIQGPLSTVDSHTIKRLPLHSTVLVSWTPPFTLDISGVDPDITGYCVSVMNSTSSTTLYSDCNITDTEFSYPIPPDADCHNYTFTVAAVNVVGVGERSEKDYSGAGTNPMVSNSLRIPPSSNSDVMANTPAFAFLLNMTAPVCDVTRVYLDDSIDDLPTIMDDSSITIMDDDSITIMANNSIMVSTVLSPHRRYNVTVEATNSVGPAISSTMISTHDTVAAEAIETEMKELVLTARYFEHSNASGALYAFIFINENGEVSAALVVLNRDTSENYTVPFSLSEGQYRVFVYDIDQGGTLSGDVRHPAVTSQLNISGNSQAPLFQPTLRLIEGCDVTTVSFLISVTCNYSRGSVATGFQVIVQLISQVKLLYVNQTNQNSATVEVDMIGPYLICIIPVSGAGIIGSDVEYMEIVMPDVPTNTPTNPGSNHPTGAVVGAVVGALIGIPVMVVIMVGAVVLVHMFQNNQVSQSKEGDKERRLNKLGLKDHECGFDVQETNDLHETDLNKTAGVTMKPLLLCKKLFMLATKWEEIARCLEFSEFEIQCIRANPRLPVGVPGSYLEAMITKWVRWAPGDARGSKDYAKLEHLEKVIEHLGYPSIAAELDGVDSEGVEESGDGSKKLPLGHKRNMITPIQESGQELTQSFPSLVDDYPAVPVSQGKGWLSLPILLEEAFTETTEECRPNATEESTSRTDEATSSPSASSL